MLSELFNSTLQITLASKFASLELSPTAHTGKAANDSRRVHRWDLEGFASSLLVWILFTFCHWLATSI